jgi:hypothetical protein
MVENGNGLTKIQVMEKVQKLMRLATSPVEAEATLAMEKAAELMEKYSITLGDCQTEDEVHAKMTRLDLKGRTMRGVMWEAILGNGIAECFDVTTVRYTKRDGWRLAFMGTKADVDLTIYFTKMLRRSVGRITTIENEGAGRSARNTFAHGMVNRIISRMKGMYTRRQEIKTSDSLALVTVKKEEALALRKKEFPRLRTTKVSVGNNRSAWDRGAAAGDRVSLNKGVNGGHQKRAIG